MGSSQHSWSGAEDEDNAAPRKMERMVAAINDRLARIKQEPMLDDEDARLMYVTGQCQDAMEMDLAMKGKASGKGVSMLGGKGLPGPVQGKGKRKGLAQSLYFGKGSGKAGLRSRESIEIEASVTAPLFNAVDKGAQYIQEITQGSGCLIPGQDVHRIIIQGHSRDFNEKCAQDVLDRLQGQGRKVQNTELVTWGSRKVSRPTIPMDVPILPMPSANSERLSATAPPDQPPPPAYNAYDERLPAYDNRPPPPPPDWSPNFGGQHGKGSTKLSLGRISLPKKNQVSSDPNWGFWR